MCLIDGESDVGARNERHLCVLYSNDSKTGVDAIHGILDLVMKKFGIEQNAATGYMIEHGDNTTFFPGQQVVVFLRGQPVGHFGVLHPHVLKEFKLNNPCSVLELNMEKVFQEFEENS